MKRPVSRGFALPGQDAVPCEGSEWFIIKLAPSASLLNRLATLQPLEEDFPPVSELPHEPVESRCDDPHDPATHRIGHAQDLAVDFANPLIRTSP